MVAQIVNRPLLTRIFDESDDRLRELGYIRLNSVKYDERARNGTWCKMPYPGHPGGCPNYPGCIARRMDFKTIRGDYQWFAVFERFDLKAHADEMRRKSEERRAEAVSTYMIIWNVISEEAVIEKAKETKQRIPQIWTEPMCRNVYYWQKGVVKKLKSKATAIFNPFREDILLEIPEANGVNVFSTMSHHGLFLKSRPDMVYKIMLVGKHPPDNPVT